MAARLRTRSEAAAAEQLGVIVQVQPRWPASRDRWCIHCSAVQPRRLM